MKHFYVKILVTLLLLMGHMRATGAPNAKLSIPRLKDLRTINGIDPKPYDRFWMRWPLVTVRFRKDNGEQRFIYANPIAFQAMKKGVTTFPDGSVFAKVAFVTNDDHEFPNSMEPIKYSRLQLMLKDSKRFAKTGGWSYWLHVAQIKDDPESDASNAIACHACHTIVKNRDYIFARPTFLGESDDDDGEDDDSPKASFQSLFKKTKVDQLNDYEKAVIGLLGKKPQFVQYYSMPLFSGSLHESIGPLAQFSQKGEIYLLVDSDKKRFLIAASEKSSAGCQNQAMIYMSRRMIAKKAGKKVVTEKFSQGRVCGGVNRWLAMKPLPEELMRD